MGGGPPGFRQDSSCPAVLRCRTAATFARAYGALTRCGRRSHAVRPDLGVPRLRLQPQGVRSYNPVAASPAGYTTAPVWARPLPLAATQGVSVDFLSSGYSDVSIPRVRSAQVPWPRVAARPGSPIRTPLDRRSVGSSPGPFAAPRVLRRQRTPRHPPRARSLLRRTFVLVSLPLSRHVSRSNPRRLGL